MIYKEMEFRPAGAFREKSSTVMSAVPACRRDSQGSKAPPPTSVIGLSGPIPCRIYHVERGLRSLLIPAQPLMFVRSIHRIPVISGVMLFFRGSMHAEDSSKGKRTALRCIVQSAGLSLNHVQLFLQKDLPISTVSGIRSSISSLVPIR